MSRLCPFRLVYCECVGVCPDDPFPHDTDGVRVENQIGNQVFRDPAVKEYDNFRVLFNGRVCSPDFNSKGAAAAYLSALEAGTRQPEYSEPQPQHRRSRRAS